MIVHECTVVNSVLYVKALVVLIVYSNNNNKHHNL